MQPKSQKLTAATRRDLERYRKQALSRGATFAKAVHPRTVKTAEWVRMKCQFGCAGYGTRLTCPPHSPTPQATAGMLKEYRAALLFAFQFDSSEQERRISRLSKRLIVDLERDAFLDGHHQAFGMACGPCRFCQSCDTASPCLHADLARPSMEACGIDVYATARANGLPIRVVRDYQDGCTYCNLLLIE